MVQAIQGLRLPVPLQATQPMRRRSVGLQPGVGDVMMSCLLISTGHSIDSSMQRDRPTDQ